MIASALFFCAGFAIGYYAQRLVSSARALGNTISTESSSLLDRVRNVFKK